MEDSKKMEILVDKSKLFHGLINDEKRTFVIFQCFFMRDVETNKRFGNFNKSNFMFGEYKNDGYEMVITNHLEEFVTYDNAFKFASSFGAKYRSKK